MSVFFGVLPKNVKRVPDGESEKVCVNIYQKQMNDSMRQIAVGMFFALNDTLC